MTEHIHRWGIFAYGGCGEGPGVQMVAEAIPIYTLVETGCPGAICVECLTRWDTGQTDQTLSYIRAQLMSLQSVT